MEGGVSLYKGKRIGLWRVVCLICFEESNKVLTVSLLFETSEHHFGSGDVLLGVDKVLHKLALVPCYTFRAKPK